MANGFYQGNLHHHRLPEVYEGMPDEIGNFVVGIGSVKKQHVVVDIHCGGNGIARRLIDTGAKVIAVEHGNGMAPAVADGGGTQPGHGREGFALSLQPGSADIVFAGLVLHHLSVPLLAIMEIKRILKPGGRLVVTDIEKYSHGMAQQASDIRRMGFYPGDIRHWLKSAGFSNIIVNPIPSHYVCRDAACREATKWTGYLIATGTA